MSNELRPALHLAAPSASLERRSDGSLVLRSTQPLLETARSASEWLHHWARVDPKRTFIAERAATGWRRVSYAEALAAAQRIGQALVRRELGVEAPAMVLSENSVDHALIALGATYVGVPLVVVSTAYSLLSQDHEKLRSIAKQVSPRLVYVSDPQRYQAALAAIGMQATSMQELLAERPDAAVERANAQVMPNHVAKILFTSGSTGAPKGVINTHRMIAANQQQVVQIWPFLAKTPPIVVDWLPWSHTFGGNFTFHMVLANGGTLYIDGGKPAPGLLDETLRNLREISPTMYFNVPRGLEMLLPHLEADVELRRTFFRRCQMVFYAAASLPSHVWAGFERLAIQERNGDMALVSAWGSTETAPMATAVHYPGGTSGVVGLPVPGCEVKLVPTAGKLEARLRGPNITPGYWKQDELTQQAFDEEGFYRIGDGLRFVDDTKPGLGLMFDGRVTEDFKLVTGTWVHVGALRVRLLEAAKGLIQDAAITGHDRSAVGALVFLNQEVAASLSTEEVNQRLLEAMRSLAVNAQGSSLVVARAIVLTEPPSLDAGETNDKAYLNQRAVLRVRSSSVERLYANPPPPEVLVA